MGGISALLARSVTLLTNGTQRFGSLEGGTMFQSEGVGKATVKFVRSMPRDWADDAPSPTSDLGTWQTCIEIETVVPKRRVRARLF